jgi:hypothetical protein
MSIGAKPWPRNWSLSGERRLREILGKLTTEVTENTAEKQAKNYFEKSEILFSFLVTSVLRGELSEFFDSFEEH